MSAVDSDRIAMSTLLGRGLPPQRITDLDSRDRLLSDIDALAERVDRLISRLADTSPADAVNQP